MNIGEEKVAKDGVHTCVLRIFFFLCCTTVQVNWVSIIQQTHNTNKERIDNSCFVFCVFVVCGCARIDNNRREYWRRKLRKMVYMRVCSAFFSFYAQLCKLSDF